MRFEIGAIREALTYAQFLGGFRKFFAETLTVERARAAVRERLERREENLVWMARTLFYGHPQSPYRQLLDHAGCSLADFTALVHDRGVEDALRELRAAGVYFSFEEFKGRQPVVRGGREFPVDEGQFDNPLVTHFYRASTSGSTGRPTKSSAGLDHLAAQSELRILLFEAHGVLDIPFAVWRPALPSGSGLNNVMRMGRIGRPAVRWFTPMVPGHYAPPLKYRLATEAAVLTARACGVKMVRPEPVGLDDALRIAEFLADTVRRDGGVCLSTTVSCGLRVAVAAIDAGIDLTGVRLFVAGEPPTPAKVSGMLASGATRFSDYGAAEVGRIALGCADPSHATDMHVAQDLAAIILHPRTVPGSDETVDSIHVTTLTATMPKVLLNLEFDDFGIVEERECGCPLGALGLNLHIREIASFRKLTGEGVTLVGSDMVHILEHTLPTRFGGSPLDYQLIQDEDVRGFTRMNLVVSPTVDLESEQEVVDTVLDALARTSVAADMARAHWAPAGSFRVVRRRPIVSARGKQMPIRVLRSQETSSETPSGRDAAPPA